MGIFDRLNSPGANLGLRMLANNNPHQNLGSSFAQGILGQQQDAASQQDQELRRRMIEAQIQKMSQPERSQDPSSFREFQLAQGNPGFAEFLKTQVTRAQPTPSSLQEWDAFQKMAPEDQKAYLNMKRQPTMPALVDVAGGKAWADRVNQTITPVTSAEQEASGAGTIAAGKARGGIVGETLGGFDKKGLQAGNILSTIDQAEPLIDVATGSATGAMIDKGAGFFGNSTDGANATAQLKVLQAKLMQDQPRMEGPQSDADVKLYREAAGQLGDPTVPRDQKKAALKAIRAINERYQQGGSTSAAPKYRDGQTATNPKTGEKMVFRGNQWVKQ